MAPLEVFRSSSGVPGHSDRDHYDVVSAEGGEPTTNPQLLNSQRPYTRLTRQDKWRKITTRSIRRVTRWTQRGKLKAREDQKLKSMPTQSSRRRRSENDSLARSGRTSYLTPTGERHFGMKLTEDTKGKSSNPVDNSTLYKNHQVSAIGRKYFVR